MKPDTLIFLVLNSNVSWPERELEGESQVRSEMTILEYFLVL